MVCIYVKARMKINCYCLYCIIVTANIQIVGDFIIHRKHTLYATNTDQLLLVIF